VQNKIVVRYRDGRTLKGSTSDFVPSKSAFHVAASDAGPGVPPVLVQVADLKAVFFVKDFGGDPAYKAQQSFDGSRPPAGRKIKVVFQDGETVVGTTQGYQADRPGFFMVPADPDDNNERCYIVAAAAQSVTLL
jgi:hypothetical protein